MNLLGRSEIICQYYLVVINKLMQEIRPQLHREQSIEQIKLIEDIS
jgi:hypothetical protein